MSQPQMPGMPYAPAAPPQTFEPPIDLPWYGITFGKAIERFFKKYVVFSGRASKSEYWWAQLFLVLVSIAFSFVSGLTNQNGFIEFLSTAWGIAVFIPGLAVAVRRLHDSNKPGIMLLLPYGLMFVGIILAFVGGIGSIFFGFASLGGSSSAAQAAGTGIVALLFAILLIIAGYVTLVVLMCMASNPEGARFDRRAASNPMAPNTMNPMSVQPMQQQPYQQQDQSGQPYVPQTTPQQYGQQQQPYYPQNPSYTQGTPAPSGYDPNNQASAQPYEQPAAPEQPYGQPSDPTQPYSQPPQDPNDQSGQSGQQFNPPYEGPRQ
ncbi:MAG: DUF805 domain-containing protein [Bifidobacterium sp.]|jgi:uncharacterized membrane protein YhaH (DUF805 family)|nr:DUF805 domain-containing protein [Bifidobacterium sp.]MCH4175151.1 DUF805 domain-containing protein [Bifidobacterium sp.]